MVPISKVPTLRAETDLWSGLEVLERTGLDALFVGAGEAGVHSAGRAQIERDHMTRRAGDDGNRRRAGGCDTAVVGDGVAETVGQ